MNKKEVVISNYAWVPVNIIKNVVRLRAALTIIPKKTSEYNEPQPIRCYEERGMFFGFPRYFFIKHKGDGWNIKENIPPLQKTEYKFVDGFCFRPGQKEIVDKVVRQLSEPYCYGAVVCCPGAFGKTVVGMAIIKELGIKPVLVVVHTEALLHQWIDRINQFMSSVEIGIIRGSKCDYINKDIVVGMLESLAYKNYPSDVYRSFGMVISDECHRIAAPTWAKAIPKFYARYRIGLTATPQRSDGAENVYFYHIGPLIKADADPGGLSFSVKKVYTNWSWLGAMPKTAVLLKHLTRNEERNRLIVKEIVDAVKAGRWIFVASDRLKHLDVLSKMFVLECQKQGIKASYDFFVGGRTKQEYEKAKNAQVLFMTLAFAAEGVDDPKRDTMLITTPKISVIKQLCARVLRRHENKKHPIIVDFIDYKVPLFKGMAMKRIKIYNELMQERSGNVQK